ncbi:MAG: OprO/OprP family phosphate-selective porin [Elusimicrobia bacterium]|nr:OprO/OprP family phosphate-selective porin [Candidatus Obscuribacterium magneticum]
MNSRRQHWLFIMLFLCGFAGSIGSFFASEGNLTVEQRLEALDQKVRLLEERQNGVAIQAGKDGFSLRSADGNFSIKFRGLLQVDGRFFTGDGAASAVDTFLLRRVRPILEGTLYKNVDFRFTPDFGGGTTAIYDAYVDIRACRFSRIRAGKFKPPVGLERLQSAADLLFAERAFPTSLVPSRDVGLAVMGEAGNDTLTYAVSFTNGVADGSLSDMDVNDGKEGALRIFAQPFKAGGVEAIKGLGLGLAGSYAGHNSLLPTYKTPGQQTFFTYNTTAITGFGTRRRFSPQGYYYYRFFGILGEFVRSEQVVRKPGSRALLANDAWQVAARIVVTGEDASFKGVSPRRIFDPKAGTWGALELAARYHELSVDRDTFSGGWANDSTSARQAQAWAVGANWYLSRAVKIMADFEQTRFKKGAVTGDRPIERVFVTRWQVAF